MTSQRTKVRKTNPPAGMSEVETTPQAPSLLDQVSAYGKLAREVYADCKKGEEAQKEMTARRNTSAE